MLVNWIHQLSLVVYVLNVWPFGFAVALFLLFSINQLGVCSVLQKHPYLPDIPHHCTSFEHCEVNNVSEDKLTFFASWSQFKLQFFILVPKLLVWAVKGNVYAFTPLFCVQKIMVVSGLLWTPSVCFSFFSVDSGCWPIINHGGAHTVRYCQANWEWKESQSCMSALSHSSLRSNTRHFHFEIQNFSDIYFIC